MTESTRAAGRLSLIAGELCLDFANSVGGRMETHPPREIFIRLCGPPGMV